MQNTLLNSLLRKFDAWQKLCKLSMRTSNVPSALHAKIDTWENLSAFKIKYAVPVLVPVPTR